MRKLEYNYIEVSDMNSQSAASELPAIIVGTLVVVAIAFVLIVQGGGLFLAGAIERAIEDGKVILGMTKDDVIRSWGRSYRAEEHSVQIMNVDELVALSWIYENRQRIVYFSSGGVVICVLDWDS